ncbi:hypothetical protein GCM10011608_13490 [Micromonospora sonchi]|uniref:Uncharacterized protein n=1 Tax=Micromonospora sonchi TaxID=1763543 RepID=A0A917TP09_9ACTN|nr:hypothetical protein GCM10011608_13490 [Micromonospora sonchi]
MLQGEGVGAQGLLLGDAGAFAQPRESGAGFCEQLRQLAESGIARSSAGGRLRSTATGSGPIQRTVRPARLRRDATGRCNALSFPHQTVFSIGLRIAGMDEVRSYNNVVYRCTYHVVWCPTY